ncbi:ABC transporter permease [Pleomorphomonas sp. PLEO]|uniref:ABC transporter permease n=1 Tax=Pleomorphomonas sp. PLEO TaxID=3239306 RepID=UPI00351E1973
MMLIHSLRSRGLLLSFAALFCVLLMLGLPLGIIVLWSVSDGWFPPSLLPDGYTARHWLMFLSDPSLKSAAINSLVITVVVTFATMIIAMPTAWALARYEFALKKVVEIFVLAPLIVPGIVVAVGLGRVFLKLDLAYTMLGVIIIQVAGVLPMTIRILASGFEAIPSDLIAAARTLGANRIAVVRHILIPLSVPAMLAAGLLSFIGSFEEFERTFIVGAPIVHTLTTRLYINLSGAGLVVPVASVVCLILLLPVFLIFMLTSRIMRDDVMAAGMGKL